MTPSLNRPTRRMLLWVKTRRPKHYTEIPFLPRCEWRWPPVSCRPQHEIAAGPRPRVCKCANPHLPAFLQVFSAHLPVPRPPAAHAHHSPGLCFPLYVGEGPPWGCIPRPSPLRHLTLIRPSLRIGCECAYSLRMSPRKTSHGSIASSSYRPISRFAVTDYIVGRNWMNKSMHFKI